MSIQEIEQAEVENTLHDDLAQAFEESNQPEEVEQIEDVEETIEEQIEALKPPEYFRKEHKTLFEKMAEIEGGRDYQQAWYDQYNEGQELINKKMKEFGDWKQEREQFNQYNQAIQPLIPTWQQQGINPAIGITQLASYAQALQADPKGTLLKLAQEHGVDLQTAFEEQPYIDPEVRTLQNKNSQLEQAQQQQEQRLQQWQQQQSQAQAINIIQNFVNSKNEKGEPLYPHFENVREQMKRLSYEDNSKPIEQLYEEAVANNVQIQKDIWKQEQAEELVKKQAEIKKAKTASQRTTSKTKDTPAQEMSLREQLEANFAG